MGGGGGGGDLKRKETTDLLIQFSYIYIAGILKSNGYSLRIALWTAGNVAVCKTHLYLTRGGMFLSMEASVNLTALQQMVSVVVDVMKKTGVIAKSYQFCHSYRKSTALEQSHISFVIHTDRLL